MRPCGHVEQVGGVSAVRIHWGLSGGGIQGPQGVGILVREAEGVWGPWRVLRLDVCGGFWMFTGPLYVGRGSVGSVWAWNSLAMWVLN